MIKNEIQLSRTEERLAQIQESIKELENQYKGAELEFWVGTLRDEATKLKSEIEEYKSLKKLPFETAVDSLLQRPVLLENIGELLAKLRIAAKLTQEEMAEKLGWQQSNISRFENDNYSSQTIAKISEYLGSLGVWLYVKPALNENYPPINYQIIAGRQRQQTTQIRTVTGLNESTIVSANEELPSFSYNWLSNSVDTSLAHELFSLASTK